MQRKIGKVILDYSFYQGEDLYSDGEVEDIILEAFQNGNVEQLLKSSNQWPILYHISNIRENLLDWYPFQKEASLLEIGAGCGALTGLLSNCVKKVTCIELSEKRSLINAERNKEKENIEIKIGNFEDVELGEKYDYITLIGVWEYAGLYVSGDEPYTSMLKKIKEYLKPDGKIIVAIENKMGMKYFNGACEDHTAKMYSGINDYVGEKNIRTFSKPEIKRVLKRVGINDVVFYYPMSDYKLPDVIYSDAMLPQTGDIRYYKRDYSDCRVYNFYDATAFDQICDDLMFDYFSNSYLFICGENEETVQFARYNRLRKKEYRIKTCIVNENGKKWVVKSALDVDAVNHINKLIENEKKWKGTLLNIEYVSGEIINETYQTPYIDGTSLDVYFYQYRHSSEAMINEVKRLICRYLLPCEEQKVRFVSTKEYEEVFGKNEPENVYSIAVTNADFIFSNFKMDSEGKLINFDYEWIFEFPIPYEFVLWRAIYQLYDKFAVYLLPQISKQDFLIKIGINRNNILVYEKMEKNFGEYVCGKKLCEKYINNYEKSTCMQNIQFR